MRDRLAGFVRAAVRELRQLRGEMITALAVAAVIAVVLDERAAVVIGVVGIAVATGALLVLSSRLRPSSAGPAPSQAHTAPTADAGDEEAKVSIARARLEEVASGLGLETPSAVESEPHSVVTPRVSVVVPCFNDARFVAEALQSVIDQTYENWECLVVDDASTDLGGDRGEPEILDSTRVGSNAGSGAARNRGLEAASGDYVAFLDADDLLLRESLADRVTALMSHLGDASVAGSCGPLGARERGPRLAARPSPCRSLSSTSSSPAESARSLSTPRWSSTAASAPSADSTRP